MTHLSTIDNNLGKTLLALGCSDETAGEVYADLSAIANTTVQDLCTKNPGLLVFPYSLGKHGDDIGTLKTFEWSGSLDQPQNAKLTTGNLMGFIGCGKAQVSITSRFTESSEPTLYKQKSEDFSCIICWKGLAWLIALICCTVLPRLTFLIFCYCCFQPCCERRWLKDGENASLR